MIDVLGSRLTTGVAVGLALFLLLFVLVATFQRRLIYLPLTRRVPAVSEVLPGGREVSFETEDGLLLHAWLVSPVSAEVAGAVVVFPGNAGHRGFRAPLADALRREGFIVLLTDYRGYADNPGRPSEAGLLRDGRAAVIFLETETGLQRDRTAYFGESLGSGVAVALAVERPPGALVLRSPFTSLADVGRHHYPLLPVRTLLRDRYPSLDRIGRIGSPLLVIAGEEDRIVPISMSRRLYQAAREPKRFVAIPGADHNDHELLAGRLLIGAVTTFLRESLSSDAAAKGGAAALDPA